ncbi:FYN-binding protein 2 [Eublepharis macularius]|uniref:FYN-binding protein 2 n=1 Tax=Eublepharis macularius TaxID=481883 RepID=A0AA97L0N6_EUBMA|nr:FYN-binding protein 2 [Eublepharis macularius]
MEMEGTGNFQALRAKFQNDSNFSNVLLRPTKKLPAEIISKQNTNGGCTTKPKPFRRAQVPDPEQKTEWSTSHKSETVQVQPVVLPRIRLRELSAVDKDEDKKSTDLLECFSAKTAPVTESPKQRPTSCLHSPEAPAQPSSFRDTLHIWENAVSHNDQKSSTIPTQSANKVASIIQLKNNPGTVTGEDTIKITANKQELVFSASNNPSHLHGEPAPFPTISPPVPPRGHTSLEKRAHETINVIDSIQHAYDPAMPNKVIQGTNEKDHYVKDCKLPKNKPLPSIVSLGPPPKKPPRPPKVDLSIFHKRLPDAVDDEYMTPECPETGEENTYEETVSYLKQQENSSSSNVAQETTHSSSTGKMKNIKGHFLTAACSSEKEDELERRAVWNNESSNQQAAKFIFKIGDDGEILAKTRLKGESFDGKNVLQKGTPQTFSERFLEKDRNFSDGYVCLEALKVKEEQAAQDPRAPSPVQALEELYDDVEGIEREFQALDTLSSFTSDSVPDSIYEETYEDVQSGDYKSTKSDNDKVEKLKKIGKFFKKEKFKMKNSQLKENICNLSSSVPNLDVMTQENMVYDDVNMEDNDIKEKNEMHKNWKSRFLVSKEKDRRRSSEDAEILSSRNLFKVKKYNVGKHSKMLKEEQLFRERFMYTKEITVINTAVAHCSNTLTKRKLDLRITAGEQLEVIDIAEGNQLICRNSEGTYGYVLLEHLNFSH